MWAAEMFFLCQTIIILTHAIQYSCKFQSYSSYKSPFNCNKKESINHLGENYALSGSEAQTMVLDLLNTSTKTFRLVL